MKNGVVLLAVGLSIVAFGGMMRIKTDVQQLVRERAKLANAQLQLKETKRVLEAEYAMLASPLRLMELAKTRGFTEMNITQVVPMDPRGLIPPAQPAGAAVADAAGIGRAAVLTAPKTLMSTVGGPQPAQPQTSAGRDAVVGAVPADAATGGDLPE